MDEKTKLILTHNPPPQEKTNQPKETTDWRRGHGSIHAKKKVTKLEKIGEVMIQNDKSGMHAHLGFTGNSRTVEALLKI